MLLEISLYHMVAWLWLFMGVWHIDPSEHIFVLQKEIEVLALLSRLDTQNVYFRSFPPGMFSFRSFSFWWNNWICTLFIWWPPLFWYQLTSVDKIPFGKIKGYVPIRFILFWFFYCLLITNCRITFSSFVTLCHRGCKTVRPLGSWRRTWGISPSCWYDWYLCWSWTSF